MDNKPLVLLLKDIRAGKVQHLDPQTLDLYGLTERAVQISSDELCERLIAEHDASHNERDLRSKLEIQYTTELLSQKADYEPLLARLQQDNLKLSKDQQRWKQFRLGWAVTSVALFALSMTGPELGQFTLGWILSMSSLFLAPKVVTVYRRLVRAGHITQKLIRHYSA